VPVVVAIPGTGIAIFDALLQLAVHRSVIIIEQEVKIFGSGSGVNRGYPSGMLIVSVPHQSHTHYFPDQLGYRETATC
jgi:hypothetical protein